MQERTADRARPLTELEERATGWVTAVGGPDDVDRERLQLLGLCPGRRVEVIQGGDPMIVRVLGTRIGVAAALARHALVDTRGEG